jgi:GLPGLI family protein
MKPMVMLIALMAAPVLAYGQENAAEVPVSGKIFFEENIKLEIKLEGDAMQFQDALPKERKAEKILWFTAGATLYEDGISKDEAMDDTEGGGVKIRMVVSGQNKLYTDLKNNKITDQRDFMNRTFLVEREVPAISWKVTGEQKIILGRQCFEAVSIDTSGKKTTAWFDPSFPVKGGPAGICGLPGMVLAAEMNEGKTAWMAKSIEPAAGRELKIHKPKEGRKVTEQEFRKIVDEKMKEMGIGNEGGGGMNHVVISIRK